MTATSATCIVVLTVVIFTGVFLRGGAVCVMVTSASDACRATFPILSLPQIQGQIKVGENNLVP